MKSGGVARLLTVSSLALVASGALSSRAQTAAELVQSQHVMIRHRLEPAEPVYVGQPVRLWVEVMTKTWFLEAPRYPATIEVRSAIVIPPEAFGVNSTERVGGETYAVQGRAFTIFPQTTGRFEVPPIEVTLVVAREDASRSPEIPVRTESVTVEARLPAGAQGHGLVLSTPGLSVREHFSRSIEELKVGDSFDRQVTVTIQDSVAMLLPPIRFEAGEGVAVYPGRPEVADQRNRGQMDGTRVDSATFVMEAEGTYHLPEIKIYWWNLRASRLEEEVLAATEFTVQANPDLAAEHLGEPEMVEEIAAEEIGAEESGLDWRLLIAGLLLLVSLLASSGHIKRWAIKWASKRKQREELEVAYFRRFRQAASTGDPKVTYAALLHWLDRFSSAEAPVTALDFVEIADDPALTRHFDALEQILYGSEGSSDSSWSGREMARVVTRARQRLLAAGQARSLATDSLPPLNPRGCPATF